MNSRDSPGRLEIPVLWTAVEHALEQGDGAPPAGPSLADALALHRQVCATMAQVPATDIQALRGELRAALVRLEGMAATLRAVVEMKARLRA